LLGEYSAVLDKVVYLGSRRFLHPDDKLRQDKSFPHGKEDYYNTTCREADQERSLGQYLDKLQNKNK